MPDRPNILLIMSDEHDAANMGCDGDPLGASPTLDGLASRGITFDSAYCNSPLYVPSRLTFTAGQYVSRCGAWQNSAWLPGDDYPSLLRVLNAVGYESYLIGKQHYDPTRSYGFKPVLPRMNGDGQHKTGHGHRRQPDDETVFVKGWKQRSAEFYPANHGGHLDHDRAWKDQALSEYYGHNICSGITMLRRGRYKYVYHSRINESLGPETELFDMQADPKEFNNLADDPAHAGTIAELHQAMLDELGEHPDDIEQRCRVDLARGYGRGKQRGW